jgi:hypothetical protein
MSHDRRAASTVLVLFLNCQLKQSFKDEFSGNPIYIHLLASCPGAAARGWSIRGGKPSGRLPLWRAAAGGGEDREVQKPHFRTAKWRLCLLRRGAGQGRQARLRRRAWELGAGAVQHQLQLFDIFVNPVLSYGCEVWGVDVLDQPDRL